MANISGTGGCVKSGSTVVVGIKEWTLDRTANVFDVTEFADTAPTHKAVVAGLFEATGTLSGNISTLTTGILGTLLMGTAYTLNLETDGSDKFSCSAYMTDINTNVAVTGEATVSASFRVNGAVTPSFT